MSDSNSNSKWCWESIRLIPSDLEVSSDLIHEMLDKLRESGWVDHELFGIHMALEETLTNAIRHGNKFDPEKRVEVDVKVSGSEIMVKISDEGPGFNPEDVPDPTAEENLDKESGRGLLLMRTYMTEVEFQGRGNTVWMRKIRETDEDED